MTLTDAQIREAAEKVGFGGVEIWWEYTIPDLRRFLEIIDADRESALAAELEKCKYKLEWYKAVCETLRKKLDDANGGPD